MNSPTLRDLLPVSGRLTPDESLERFLGYVSAAGLTLYPAQEEALLELFGGSHVLLKTPTGSGKSLVAAAFQFKALSLGQRSVYTAPVKALVNEKFFALCDLMGPENVGMLTGDATINRDAPVLCCTQEVLSNWLLREPEAPLSCVVMDEFHYYGDPERGVAWQLPLLTLPDAQFLLMSATLGATPLIEESLAALTGKPVKVVESGERPVPLTFEYRETPLHETLADLIGSQRAPVYLVNFTQRSAAEQAQNLMSVEVTTKEGKEQIKQALLEERFDTPFGKELQRYLRHGVGLHHAGMLPRYRRLVERLAQKGLLKVVSGTDTLGVGVNIPIRTVLLTQLIKFNGEKTAVLSVRDFLQIAGRAGRRGFDTEGWVVAQAPEHVIENLKLAQREAAGKKVVKQKPPPHFVHYDRKTFERLTTGTPEPLESRFTLTHGMLLNLLQATPRAPQAASVANSGGGYARLVQLLLRSHERPVRQQKLLKHARVLLRGLVDAGIVNVHRAPPRLEVSPSLQEDFSLHHTLSLFVLDTLPRLDAQAESYPLDVITLGESVLENPMPVLLAQKDRVWKETLAELKAKGMEYEERQKELENVTWPKPLADFLYAHFNDFEAKHPWVNPGTGGQENVHPKSIVRELLEGFPSFDDYVRDYGLQRSEGVLLRYLSQAYRLLQQTIPVDLRTVALDDLIESLRTLVRSIDSSLLDEWEGLGAPEGVKPVLPTPAAPKRPDPRTFAARVRSELHALTRALATESWDAARASMVDPSGAWPSKEWTDEKLKALMATFHVGHSALKRTPDTRQPEHTLLRQETPTRWSAQQRLFGVEGEEDGFLECEVDLEQPRGEGLPLITLRRMES